MSKSNLAAAPQPTRARACGGLARRLVVATLALLAFAAGVASRADALDLGAVWQARHGLSAARFQSTFDALVGQGYRLVWISGTAASGQEEFSGIWEKSAGPVFMARSGLDSSTYQSEFDRLVRQGYRPVLVNGYGVGGQDRYVAIWEQRSGPAWAARHGMTSAQYSAEFSRLAGLGYRLVHVSGYEVAGSDRYAAIWEQRTGPPMEARHGMTAAQYQSTFDLLAARGYRPVHVSGYTVQGSDRYAAIWEQGDGAAWVARHGLPAAGYQNDFDAQVARGYRLVNVSAYGADGSVRYATIWQRPAAATGPFAALENGLTAYMSRFGIPGLSVAVVKDGRLVHAKGFGIANPATGERVDAGHRFRIASVSKPVTAVAILRLVEQGKLSLNRKVFGARGILGREYGTRRYGRWLKKITVRHLLAHTSGFSPTPTDPMFQSFELDQHALISKALDEQPPVFKPGTQYAYSNFGYLLLGRIIEKVTGLSYETYVTNEVLARAGITGMEIGGDALADRAAHEAAYGGAGDFAYHMRVSRMDAHGGWIASPSDLLRLMVRVDGLPGKADLLSPSSLATMWTGSTANVRYGLGWIVDGDAVWHNGAMPGTLSLLVRRDDGIAYAVTANLRPTDDGFASTLKQVVEDGLARVTNWPTHDLF